MDNLLKKPVRDVMQKNVVSVQGGETIKNVFKLMEDHGIVGLPVVDETGGVIGIVTETDLIKHFTTLSTPLTVILLGSVVYLESAEDWSKHLKEHTAELVKDIMNPEVILIRDTQTLQEAIDVMAEEEVNRLPVVDETGKLSGIVTRKDIVHQFSQLKTL